MFGFKKKLAIDESKRVGDAYSINLTEQQLKDFRDLDYLPGFKKDPNGNYLFFYTDDELEEIKEFHNDMRDLTFHPDIVDQISAEFTSLALDRYAEGQVEKADPDSFNYDKSLSKANKTILLQKAIAAYFKSLSISHSELTYYRLANALWLIDKKAQARKYYKEFLDKASEQTKEQLPSFIENSKMRLFSEIK